jgi:peptidoglycan/xylan/chitin deacetylase (PgdA/CDA1 family)
MVVLLLILIVQTAGLYSFYIEQDTLANFKLSYATKVYYPSYRYRFVQLSKRIGDIVDEKFFGSPPTHAEQIQAPAVSIPVLLYHGVLERSDGANVDIDTFRDQMFSLKQSGYQTVSDQDFYDFMDGQKSLPQKSFLLTFDDGRKDSYYPVDPILKALHYRATMFVITNRVAKRQKFHLSIKELQQMNQSGHWDFQSHGRNDHDPYQIAQDGTKGRFLPNKFWSTDLTRFETQQEYTSRIQTDLTASKADMEKLTHRRIFGFAFPFGDYGQNESNFPLAQTLIANQVKSVYDMAFFQLWQGNGNSYNYPGHDQFMMKRLEVRPNWDGATLVTLLNNGEPKPFPFFDDFKTDLGWVQNWGKVDSDGSTLNLSAVDGASGAGTFLDGTYLWQDYTYSVHVKSMTGTTASLLTKVQEPNRVLACNFTAKNAWILEQNGTKETTLAESDISTEVLKPNDELAVKSHGTTVECMVNGKTVVKSDKSNPSLDHGGIGMKVWDPVTNKARLVIDKVTVTQSQ